MRLQTISSWQSHESWLYILSAQNHVSESFWMLTRNIYAILLLNLWFLNFNMNTIYVFILDLNVMSSISLLLHNMQFHLFYKLFYDVLVIKYYTGQNFLEWISSTMWLILDFFLSFYLVALCLWSTIIIILYMIEWHFQWAACNTITTKLNENQDTYYKKLEVQFFEYNFLLYV